MPLFALVLEDKLADTLVDNKGLIKYAYKG